jgi:hypothetical protein
LLFSFLGFLVWYIFPTTSLSFIFREIQVREFGFADDKPKQSHGLQPGKKAVQVWNDKYSSALKFNGWGA